MLCTHSILANPGMSLIVTIVWIGVDIACLCIAKHVNSQNQFNLHQAWYMLSLHYKRTAQQQSICCNTGVLVVGCQNTTKSPTDLTEHEQHLGLQNMQILVLQLGNISYMLLVYAMAAEHQQKHTVQLKANKPSQQQTCSDNNTHHDAMHFTQ